MSNLPSKIIFCPRSGTKLLEVTAICSQGWPMLSSIQASFLHPVYSFPLEKLIVRISKQLTDAESQNWQPSEHEQIETSLSMSAIMWHLDALVQTSFFPEASLPAWPTVLSTASRLRDIATWWHFATSKRLTLPTYHPCTSNNNLQWQNFTAWLDAAFSVKEEWETGRRKYATEEERKRTSEAIRELKKENIYKRIDFNKVWNWIDAQIAVDHKRYPLGRRETFKTLFMSADMNPQDWTVDDVDDLTEAVFDCCDQGNEITHFIGQRLRNIRASLQEFYGSFTLLNSGLQTSADVTQVDNHTPQEASFFAEFDRRAESLESLPPAPKREHFTSLGLYLKAQAQHNILARRFELANKK
jgi:hypothetical protein